MWITLLQSSGFFVASQVVSQVVTVTFVVVLEACGQIDLYMRLLTWHKWQHSLDAHWSSSEKFCLLMLISQITYTHTLCTCHWPGSGHISFVSMRSNSWKRLFVNANTINANLNVVSQQHVLPAVGPRVDTSRLKLDIKALESALMCHQS